MSPRHNLKLFIIINRLCTNATILTMTLSMRIIFAIPGWKTFQPCCTWKRSAGRNRYGHHRKQSYTGSNTFRQGILVYELNSRVVGVIYSQRIQYRTVDDDKFQECFFTPYSERPITQLLALNVLPELKHLMLEICCCPVCSGGVCWKRTSKRWSP